MTTRRDPLAALLDSNAHAFGIAVGVNWKGHAPVPPPPMELVCPACLDATTIASPDGHVGPLWCQNPDCPDPTLLGDLFDSFRATGPDGHYGTFTEDEWALEHSLRCRITGMLDCVIHKKIAALERPPGIGRYRVSTTAEGELMFETARR